MSPGSRARSGLLAVVLLTLVPVATAQLPIPTPSPTPPALVPTSKTLDIQQGPLTFLGPANDPQFVAVDAPDGTPVLTYRVDENGRARLDVAGGVALTDATFVRLEGDPTGDAFRLVLRDPQGGEHKVDVDRAALAAVTSALPPTEPPVKVERPPNWPGAPDRSYLLFAEDAARNHLSPAQLSGAAYLQRTGAHRAVLQVPLAENSWDRFFLTARRDGQPVSTNTSFATAHSTDTALILLATWSPSLLSPADGERIAFGITYEKRLSPLVAQRFGDGATYKFLVDGLGPSVAVNAPSSSPDFRFTVTWSGGDAHSGIGAYAAYYREAGAPSWTHWTTTPESGAIFSGAWGKTYDFRVRSLDKVWNPSANEATATVRVAPMPASEDDINDPPSVRILAPAVGAQLSGSVPVTWAATDPDGTRLTVRLEVSDDDGRTWRLLYAGPASETVWDTTSEAEGSGYRLRVTVSDGTQTASDVVPALTVRNVLAPLAPPDPEPQTPPATGGASPTPGAAGSQPAAPGASDEPVAAAEDVASDGGNRTPMPAFLIVGALGLAALATRKKR